MTNSGGAALFHWLWKGMICSGLSCRQNRRALVCCSLRPVGERVGTGWASEAYLINIAMDSILVGHRQLILASKGPLALRSKKPAALQRSSRGLPIACSNADDHPVGKSEKLERLPDPNKKARPQHRPLLQKSNASSRQFLSLGPIYFLPQRLDGERGMSGRDP